MFSGLAATTAVAATGLPVQAAPLPSSDQTLASHALKIFSSPQSARRLGASCCAQEGYISRNTLIQSVFGSDRHRLATASHAEVRDWLHAKIRQDLTLQGGGPSIYGAEIREGADFAPSRRDQATRRESGIPRPVMMFSTLQATLASVFCAGRLRAWRPRPTSFLYRNIATSANERFP
jgi:hypothetical protein